MKNKRLYKVDKGKVFMGVAQGVAEYINADVSIVRLVFVILVFTPAMPILIIYIIMGLVLPEKNDVVTIIQDKEDSKPKYTYTKPKYNSRNKKKNNIGKEFEIDEDDYSINEDDYKY